jgi:putative hydrolase of the HAD superfamily
LIGSAKPDGTIFRTAALRCQHELDGGWMIGDNPVKDIGGGADVGLQTAWISRHRPWPRQLDPPTIVADSFPAAVEGILALTRP